MPEPEKNWSKNCWRPEGIFSFKQILEETSENSFFHHNVYNISENANQKENCFCIDTFGTSGPANKVAEAMGFTAEKLAKLLKK